MRLLAWSVRWAARTPTLRTMVSRTTLEAPFNAQQPEGAGAGAPVDRLQGSPMIEDQRQEPAGEEPRRRNSRKGAAKKGAPDQTGAQLQFDGDMPAADADGAGDGTPTKRRRAPSAKPAKGRANGNAAAGPKANGQPGGFGTQTPADDAGEESDNSAAVPFGTAPARSGPPATPKANGPAASGPPAPMPPPAKKAGAAGTTQGSGPPAPVPPPKQDKKSSAPASGPPDPVPPPAKS